MGLYSEKRLCTEKGMVTEKIYRESTEERIYNGQKVDAQPEKYSVVCVSSNNFNDKDGFVDGAYLQYRVEKDLYDKLKFMSKVLVTYDMSGNTKRPVSVELFKD